MTKIHLTYNGTDTLDLQGSILAAKIIKERGQKTGPCYIEVIMQDGERFMLPYNSVRTAERWRTALVGKSHKKQREYKKCYGSTE